MTTDTELPPWAAKLPDWVRDDEVRWLARRPWIAGFIEPKDYSLDPAIARFERSQRLIRTDVTATATRSTRHPELISLRGMETTSFRYSAVTENIGVVRGVSIQTSNPGHISGLAVPYQKRSTPVIAAGGVLCVEQFDRDSFAKLPLSVPLRVEHDEASSLGQVTERRHTSDGLAIAARIDTDDRQLWAERWVRGQWSSLSIGFAGSSILDDWSATREGLALRTVRGATLIEVSVCRDPAYPQARITEVTE